MSVAELETSPAVTPEDLLHMPDGGKGLELVHGEIKELNVSFLSSFLAGEFYAILRDFVRPHKLGWVVPEGTSFRCFPFDRNRVRRADTAFIAFARITRDQVLSEGHCTVVPDLVVEVISPNDLAGEVNQKVQEWQQAGVRLVWVVDPETKLVFTHRPDRVEKLQAGDTLVGDPVLPGFSCPVADLFRLPTPPTPAT